MKKFKVISLLLMAFIFTFVGCKKDNIIEETDIIPANFRVDIPNTLSNYEDTNTKSDIPGGNEVYVHLTNFIAVGDAAAEIVEDIIVAIREYNLSQAQSFSFQSEEDGRTKHVVIVENSEFEGAVWEFQLTMTDEDGGKGLQVFWNVDPVKGIAILNPYNLNRNCVAAKTGGYYWVNENTMYRVDYSEAETAYEAQMTVYIAGLTLPDVVAKPVEYDRFTMETMKMFAGKNGDIIDVYGNSSHPLAWFLNPDKVGYNWAFVAAGDLGTDRAVAEVGLPLNTVNTTDRTILLEDNSIHNVLYDELAYLYPGLSHEDLLVLLVNTEAPAYFSPLGFVSAGTPPEGSTAFDAAEASMNLLTPYNPFVVSNLEINFKE